MELLKALWQLVLLVINPIFSVPVGIVIAVFVWKNKEYKRSSYYQVTKLSYWSMSQDVGRYGEYLTYKNLKHYEKYGARFLFNVYIPKNGDQTTEIDVLMICPYGLFVFESKNFSGWIFGSGNQKYWYQTFAVGRGRSHKVAFYNPIMQNRSHIKCLQAFLGEQPLMHSFVVFSDRCTLRNITFNANETSVVNRQELEEEVYNVCGRVTGELLSDRKIAELYDRLYPFTQVNETVKKQHVDQIHRILESVEEQQMPQSISCSTVRIETAEETPDENTNIASMGVAVDEISAVPEKDQAPESVVTQPKNDRCPLCGGRLILRTATRGSNAGNRFFGCSHYPRCRYIQNIDNKTV